MGSGSFGTVYKAVLDTTLDVAVKRLNASVDVSPGQLQAFTKEITFMNACRHPGIVNFLGACLMEACPVPAGRAAERAAERGAAGVPGPSRLPASAPGCSSTDALADQGLLVRRRTTCSW